MAAVQARQSITRKDIMRLLMEMDCRLLAVFDCRGFATKYMALFNLMLNDVWCIKLAVYVWKSPIMDL